jgi:uncharacterized protein (DUF2336 family)
MDVFGCNDAAAVRVVSLPTPRTYEMAAPIRPSLADSPMTAKQVIELRRLAEAAYEPEAFKDNLSEAEAGRRIAALSAKLKLLGGPPHTL